MLTGPTEAQSQKNPQEERKRLPLVAASWAAALPWPRSLSLVLVLVVLLVLRSAGLVTTLAAPLAAAAASTTFVMLVRLVGRSAAASSRRTVAAATTTVVVVVGPLLVSCLLGSLLPPSLLFIVPLGLAANIFSQFCGPLAGWSCGGAIGEIRAPLGEGLGLVRLGGLVLDLLLLRRDGKRGRGRRGRLAARPVELLMPDELLHRDQAGCLAGRAFVGFLRQNLRGDDDPKLDRCFRHDLHQGSPPTSRPSPTDVVMGQGLDKLFLLGAMARACDVPEVSGRPTHNVEHGLMPKLDQDGHPSGEHRTILRGRHASSNENVPTFSGPTDCQFVEFLDLDDQLMRSDGKKMFHQFRARQSQSQLMRFCHPASGELHCHLATCMGISGGSRVAQTCTGAICRWMGVNLFIPAFGCCDEFINERKGRLLSFLQQLVTVAVLVLFGARLNWEKTDLAVPCQQRVFLGILADTTRLRASPSPGRLRLLREAARSIREDWLAGKSVSASRPRSLAGSARSCLRLHSTMGFRTIKITAALRQRAQRHSPSRRDFRRPPQPSAIQWTASELRFLEASHPMEEFRHANRHRDVPPATFVSDASEWGFAAHGLTDEIQGFNVHLFHQTEERDHSHNVQEGLGPLLCADALWDQQILPPGRFGHPAHVQAPLDNQTAVSAIEKLRAKSLQLAKELIPRVIAWHDQGWVSSARHLIKEIMDTKHSVDQVGRLKSLTRMFRGIPQRLFDQLECDLRNRTTAPPPSRWVDVFTSFTVRKSNLCVSGSTESRIPESLWEDAFHPRFLWNHSRNPQLNPRWGLCLFPPDRLVSAVLDRLTADHSPCCLLVCQFGCHVPTERIEAMQTSPIVFFAMHPESFRHAPTLGGPACTFLGVILSVQSSS